MKNSIASILEQYKSGTPLESLIPEDADLGWWRANIDRLARNQANPKRLKKAVSGSRRRQSKRSYTASSVLVRDIAVGRAMAEQVRRVNSRCEICDNRPAAIDGLCEPCYNGTQEPGAVELAEYAGEARVILWGKPWGPGA